jgi:hypothetical protein
MLIEVIVFSLYVQIRIQIFGQTPTVQNWNPKIYFWKYYSKLSKYNATINLFRILKRSDDGV